MGTTTIPTPNDAYISHQEPVHRADPSGPGHRVLRSNNAPGAVAPHGVPPPRRARAAGPRASGGPGAPRGRTSRGGNSRGSSTSPSISQSRPGSPIWRQAMAKYGNDHLVIYGYSQSAVIANMEKQKLAEQYPREPRPPISTSCWAVTSICPTGAFSPGSRAFTSRSSICRSTAPRRPTPSSYRRHHPSVRWRGGFPVVSAQPRRRPERASGCVYVHLYGVDVSLAPDASKSPAIQGRTVTPPITSSRRRTCRCSVRCARWGCPSR